MDMILDLQGLAQSGYHIAYHRLCQVAPNNRISFKVTPIVDCYDNMVDIYTHSNTIRYVIDEIIANDFTQS